MTSVIRRLRGWWNRDALEGAEEESVAHMSSAERALAEEEYEGRKDDLAAADDLIGAPVDWERDSEPPRPYRSN